MIRLSPIARYFDFTNQYECDQDLYESTLHRRDREFALKHGENSADTKLLKLWQRMRAQENPRPQTHKWQQRHHLYTLILSLLGLISGFGIARGVLHYDGQHPINLISVITVLVFLQLFILAILALTSLPFMRRLQDALSVFNPALWITRLIDRLGQHHINESALSHLQAMRKIDQSILMNYLLTLAQYFAIAFNVGIIACLLFLVFSSDLAFGWNTTLQIDNAVIHNITNYLSLPWQSWYADAVPSAQLIDISRYYRLDEALSNRAIYLNDYALQLGSWWKFIALCFVFYGLLPRIVLMILFKRRLTHSVAQSIWQHPYSQTLLSRMRTPMIDTMAHAAESHLNKQDIKHRALRTELNLNMTCPVLTWSNAVINTKQLKKFGITASRFVDIGGNYTPKQDKQALQEICAAQPAGLVFVCKGWESPTYDLIDTIELSRKLLKDKKKPILVLLSTNDDVVLSQDQFDCWETMFNEHDDTNVYVEAVKTE